MKKKTLFGIVLVLSIIAIYNICKSQDCKKISNLMLSDLESLADSSEGCISKTDKNNQLLVIGEADKKIYPCILQLGNGKITDIYYQSPYEDGFSIVEKYFNSVL